jgi:hypothetical protein
MKKCMKNLYVLVALAALLLVASCGGDEKDKTIAVTRIELNPTTLSLDPGEPAQITITVLPVEATDKSYVCTSENEAVAKISAGGLVTAVTTGTTKVWVKTPDGKISASANVEVKAVDYGKEVAATYEGILDINTGGETFYIDLPLTLEYVSINKVKFSATAMVPAVAFSEQLAPFGLPDQPVSISGDVNVTTDDAGGHLLTGGGGITIPQDFADILGLPMAGSTFEIKPEKAEDKLPGIDKNGNIYMRLEIFQLGEVFYNGKKK